VVEKLEVGGAGNAPCVFLTLPNIEYMQGYLLAGFSTGSVAFNRLNVARSGWSVRIYRRRLTADFVNYTDLGTAVPGASVTSLRKLDIDDSFYLLAEVRVDDLNEGRYQDRGEVIPDYLRPLRIVHGYQGYTLYPKPDDRYEIVARLIRRPPLLESEHDVTWLHPAALDLILAWARSLVYEKFKSPGDRQAALNDYQAGLGRMARRHGNPKPAHQPGLTKPGRIRRIRIRNGSGGRF
jgi:hypothetical protein